MTSAAARGKVKRRANQMIEATITATADKEMLSESTDQSHSMICQQDAKPRTATPRLWPASPLARAG